jgi:hypothetical protein
MLDPYILSPVLNSLSFGISEFHLRMRQICRPKLYNYPIGERNLGIIFEPVLPGDCHKISLLLS